MNAPEAAVVNVETELAMLPSLAAPPRSSAAATVMATLAVIAALWWGQRFLIPLAAGLMLAMLVMPLAVRLESGLRSRAAATVLSLAKPWAWAS